MRPNKLETAFYKTLAEYEYNIMQYGCKSNFKGLNEIPINGRSLEQVLETFVTIIKEELTWKKTEKNT